MTLILDDWHKVKKRLEEIRRQADKVEARLAQAMEEIKARDGVNTLKQAELRHAKRTRAEIQAFQKWNKMYKAFRKKYGRRLGL